MEFSCYAKGTVCDNAHSVYGVGEIYYENILVKEKNWYEKNKVERGND